MNRKSQDHFSFSASFRAILAVSTLLLLSGCGSPSAKTESSPPDPPAISKLEVSISDFPPSTDWLLFEFEADRPENATVHYSEIYPQGSPLDRCTAMTGMTGFASVGQVPRATVFASALSSTPIVDQPLPQAGPIHVTFDDEFQVPAGRSVLLLAFNDAQRWLNSGATASWFFDVGGNVRSRVVAYGQMVCLPRLENLRGDIVHAPGVVRVRNAFNEFKLEGTGWGWASAYADQGYSYRLMGPPGEIFSTENAPGETDLGHQLRFLDPGSYRFEVPRMDGTSGDAFLAIADLDAQAQSLLNETWQIV